MRARVSNKECLADSRVRGFRRKNGHVLDNSLEVSILVTNRQDEVVRQLEVGANDVFILEAEFGAGSDGADIRLRNGNRAGQPTSGICTTQQVSSIDDRNRRAIRVKRNDALTGAIDGKCRSKASAGKVELL